MDKVFVHAAELRLDAPLTGLQPVPQAVAVHFRDASLQAFDELIRFTLERKADFLLLTGELWEGIKRGVRPLGRMRKGFARLAESAIPVFIETWKQNPLDPDWLENVYYLDDPDRFPEDHKGDRERILGYLARDWGERECSTLLVSMQGGDVLQRQPADFDPVRVVSLRAQPGDLSAQVRGLQKQHPGKHLVVRIYACREEGPRGLAERQEQLESLRRGFAGEEPVVWCDTLLPCELEPLKQSTYTGRDELFTAVSKTAESLAERTDLFPPETHNPSLHEQWLAILSEAEARVLYGLDQEEPP